MIADNYKIVEEKIAQKCLKTGRNRSDITLIAVSKSQPNTKIIEAFNSGIIHFGENKAQELNRKAGEISENFIWHFVGHLQTNKVKYVTGRTALIHSCDRYSLAETLNQQAAKNGIKAEVLIQVNTSEEETKYGFRPDQAEQAVSEISRLPHVTIRGLMTIGPLTEDEARVRKSFRILRQLKERLIGQFPGIDCTTWQIMLKNLGKYSGKN